MCNVKPFTNCEFYKPIVRYNETKPVQMIFNAKKCVEGPGKVVEHEKLRPKCRNVTKMNCITKWKVDDDGNQVSFQICIHGHFLHGTVFIQIPSSTLTGIQSICTILGVGWK